MIEYQCMCGHVIDEHEDGFFKPCTIDGCECDDFQPTDLDYEDEDA